MNALLATSLGLYLFLVLYLGYRANRANGNTQEDFFLLGRSVGVRLLVGSVAASMVNSMAVTGTPSLFYTGGILFSQMFVAVTAACGLMWFFGPKVAAYARNSGSLTQGELFGRHYRSRPMHLLVAALGVLSTFPFLSIQLAGVGKIVSAGSGGAISFESAALVFALCIGLYVFFGGARAAVWTDSLQGLTAFFLFSLMALLFVNWAGGLPQSLETVRTVMPEKLGFTATSTRLFLDSTLSWSFAFFLWPHLFIRCFMAKKPSELRGVAVISFLVLISLLTVILVLTIAATAKLYGTLEDPDHLLATMLGLHLSDGGLILLILVLALTMSTVDSMILALAAIISRDLRSIEQSDGLKRSRLSTLAILGLATFLAINTIGQSALVPWVTLGASIITLLLWPLIGIFVLHQTKAWPSLLSICAGFTALCIVRFTPAQEILPFGFATTSFVVGGITFTVSSILLGAKKQ